jgi:hypothetical protein
MTHAHSVNELVERGREAAARGAWREAYDLLVAADSAELSAEDLELIGEATFLGRPDRALHPGPRAGVQRLPGERGPEECRAARSGARPRSQPGAREFGGSSGRFRRAERLLEDEPECREHGYLARGQAMAADARGDTSEARQHVQRALEIAERFGDRDLEPSRSTRKAPCSCAAARRKSAGR